VHLLHQRQEDHNVIDTLVGDLKLFFHAPQSARKFRFCLAHYANGEYLYQSILNFSDFVNIAGIDRFSF
ncbi:MAG TPA: hypothetical protein VGF67_28235, partial [Ktedonobacteraceae bacterium]